jgi:hypothetical protein
MHLAVIHIPQVDDAVIERTPACLIRKRKNATACIYTPPCLLQMHVCIYIYQIYLYIQTVTPLPFCPPRVDIMHSQQSVTRLPDALSSNQPPARLKHSTRVVVLRRFHFCTNSCQSPTETQNCISHCNRSYRSEFLRRFLQTVL